jgi:MFS family permease
MSDLAPANESSEDEYGSPTYAWYVVTILLFAYVTSFLDRTILTLLVEPIRESLGISDLQLSLLHGFAFAIFYVSLGVPIARYADSHNRVRLISVGVLVWSLMTAVCGLAKNFTHMFLARVGVGIGEATLSPAAYSIISDYFPVEKRPRAYSIYQTGIYIGMGLAMIIGGYVIAVVPSIEMPFYGHMEPWQVVFLLVGLPGILIFLLLLQQI